MVSYWKQIVVAVVARLSNLWQLLAAWALSRHDEKRAGKLVFRNPHVMGCGNHMTGNSHERF